VGTAQGQVALYRGLPYTVLGVDLYDLTEVRPTDYADLEGYVQERIGQRELMTREEGQRFVRSLSEGVSTTTSSLSRVGSPTTRSSAGQASPASPLPTLRSTTTAPSTP
jgi:hypothetical protein